MDQRRQLPRSGVQLRVVDLGTGLVQLLGRGSRHVTARPLHQTEVVSQRVPTGLLSSHGLVPRNIHVLNEEVGVKVHRTVVS